VVTAGSLLQMVLQLAIQTLIARQFGTTRDANDYEAAIAAPLVLAAILGLPIGSVLIPVVSQADRLSGSSGAWSAATRIGVGMLIVTVSLAGILTLCASAIIPMLFAGLAPADAAIATRLMQILAWLIPANVMTAYCQAAHNWQGRFWISALAGVVGPGVTLGIIAWEGSRLPIEHVAVAALAGAVVNVVVQLPLLLPRFHWGSDHRVMANTMRLLLPLLLGGLYLRIDPIVDRAIGSWFGDGTLACMGNAGRVINAALAVVVGGLSVVAFPRMARAAQVSSIELGREMADAIRALVTILVPVTAALWFFGGDLIHDLFERGRFTAADTTRVALFVRCALGVVIGGSLGEIASRVFYAKHDMKTPTVIGIACFVVALGLKLSLSRWFGPGGILAATSLAWCGSAAIQVGLLSSRLGSGVLEGVLRRLLGATAGTAAACLAGMLVVHARLPLGSIWGGLAGLAVYVAVMSFLIRRQRKSAAVALADEPPAAEEIVNQPAGINLP